MKIMIALLFMCFTTAAWTDSTILSMNNFKDITRLLQQQQHPHQVLLALDDDDTLTMMPCHSPAQCQYLGGPAWFTWQSTLPVNSKDRIWKTFSQLLAINNLLFTMSRMVIDDPEIPATLKTADRLGISIVIATARGGDMIGTTETQFSQDHIFKLIEKNAIKTNNHHISYPGFYLPKPWSKKPVRPIAYAHGVLYLAGQNKGVMLQQFLSKTHQSQHIRTIIFVDDTMQNVTDVANAYAHNSLVYVISIHYTRLAAHKAAFLTGKNAKKLQQQANQQWFAIRDAMRKHLIGAVF